MSNNKFDLPQSYFNFIYELVIKVTSLAQSISSPFERVTNLFYLFLILFQLAQNEFQISYSIRLLKF